jgi:hypothetical protein
VTCDGFVARAGGYQLGGSVRGGNEEEGVVKRVGVIGVVLALTALGVGAATERAAAIEPVVEENLPTVSQHLRRGGTFWTPPTCGTTCQTWWLEEHRPIPNQPSSKDLHSELFKARSRIGLLKVARYAFAGTLLGLVATEIAIRIGDKLLFYEQPAAGAGGGNQRLSPKDPGSTLSVGYPSKPVATYTFPEAGWAWQHEVGSNNWHSMTGNDPNCPGPAVSTSLHIVSPGTYNICGDPLTDLGPGTVTGGYVLASEISSGRPVEDYVDQPYQVATNPMWAPTDAATEQALEDELASNPNEYRVAEAWWAHQLDPQNHDDATERDDPCELGSGATSADPGLGRGTADSGQQFLDRYEQVPSTVAPATGFPTVNGTVYLRWGWTSPNVDNPHIDWRGWGYRKIAAKHGWSSADATATATALLDTTPTAQDADGDRYRYVGPTYPGANGAVCQRVVVVNHDRTFDEVNEGATAPAHIITSYGRRVG